MATNEANKTASTSDVAGLLAQAAASLAASTLRTVMGSQPGETPEKLDDSWIGRAVAQYRQALGHLVGLVPRILERVVQVIDSTTGHKLLFRTGRPAVSKRTEKRDRTQQTSAAQALDDFLWKYGAKPMLVSQAQLDSLKLIPAEIKSRDVLERLGALVKDDRRKDLPRLLDELKHEVREDRTQGIRRIQEALGWLLQSDGTDVKAYELLDNLSDVLGEDCLRELQRLHSTAVESLLSCGVEEDEWLEGLRKCFKAFGHQLSEYVSVVRGGTENPPELIVMDHQHDRFFEVRAGSGSTTADPWAKSEIYGAENGRDYMVGQIPIKLPLRVHDAAQGMAVWSVDKRSVQQLLEAFPGQPKRVPFPSEPKLEMRAWDTGANRTPVALFFVHYRDSDAGEYYELGLGCFVAPRKDPLSVGVYTVGSILVSTEEARAIGAEIWGYEKEHVPHKAWTVEYRPTFLQCCVKLKHATLSLRLPRGGVQMASTLPILSYTRKPLGCPDQWHRSVLTRFARGESVRATGSGVELSLEVQDKYKDEAFSHPLLKALYQTGLVGTDGRGPRALQAAWTQHVSAQLGPPMLVPLPGQDYD